MKKSLLVSLLGVGLLAGCGTTARQAAAPAIGVALSPSTNQGIDQGQTKSVTAMVSNDSSNKGVNWVVSLTQGGTSCAPGCGSVSPTSSTTAPFTTTYTAPSSSTPTVFVTAASAADTTKSASVRITVAATPVLTPPAGGALPAATVGVPYTFNLTTLLSGGTAPFTWSISSGTLPAGLMLNSSTGVISGTAFITKPSGFRAGSSSTVTSDPTIQATDSGNPPVSTSVTVTIPVNPPPALTITSTSPLPDGTLGTAYTFTFQATGGFGTLTWTLATGSTLPTGLSLSTDGVLSGTPAQFGPFTFAVSVTDSESTPMTAMATFSLTIVVGPLTITSTSPLPNASVGTAYTFTFQASGGVPPLTWALAPGSTLPAGLMLSTGGVLSGTPQTVGGPTTFSVVVTDSETPTPMTASATFSITINAAISCTVGPTTLCGQFAFLVQGFISQSGLSPLAIAGTFTADGKGNVIGGVLDVNFSGITHANVPIIISGSGSPTGFNVGPDGRGMITFGTNLSGVGTSPNFTFAFALSSTGTFAHMVEFDDTTTSGTGRHTSGFMLVQDPSAFNASSISGNFAFGFLGSGVLSTTREGWIGIATAASSAASPCGLNSDGSTTTINSDGIIRAGVSFTCSAEGGLPTIDSTTGRGTVSLFLSLLAGVPQNFSFYVVNKRELIFILTSSTGSPSAVLSGMMTAQGNHAPDTFSGSDVACGISGAFDKGCVFEASGESGGGANVVLGRAVKQADGTLTIQRDRNKAGAVTNGTETGFTFSIQPAGNGTIAPPATSTEKATDFVLIDTDIGFVLEENGAVSFGFVRPQTATTFASSPGTFILGTRFVANGSVPNVSGVLTPSTPAANGSGTLAGTLDVEQVFLPPFLLPGVVIPMPGGSATYTLDATTGRGTGTVMPPPPAPPGLLSSFVFDVVGADQIALIETDPATINPNPVLINLTSAHAIFNFDSDFVGEATPFSETQNGLTAVFSSPADPGGFAVFPTFFSSLTGNVLIDGAGASGFNQIPLTITFSQDATSISMRFATNSAAPVPFVLTAFENGVQVGQVSASGVIPAGFIFPEGFISFSGARFNSVVLSSTATDIAIDNVAVTPAP